EMSGREVAFLTAVALARGDGPPRVHLDTTRVRFRRLDGDEIARYVDTEQPFDCAGSFKSEGLGIALFEAIDSSDPTALVGLPLIALARMLREAGFALPCTPQATGLVHDQHPLLGPGLNAAILPPQHQPQPVRAARAFAEHHFRPETDRRVR